MEEQEVIALQPACSSPGVAARGPGQGSGAAPQLPANHCLRARQKPAAAGCFPVSVVANLRQNIVLRFLNLRRKDVKVGEKERATIFGSRPLEKKKKEHPASPAKSMQRLLPAPSPFRLLKPDHSQQLFHFLAAARVSPDGTVGSSPLVKLPETSAGASSSSWCRLPSACLLRAPKNPMHRNLLPHMDVSCLVQHPCATSAQLPEAQQHFQQASVVCSAPGLIIHRPATDKTLGS